MRALLLGLALLAPGCGPIQYLSQVTGRASRAVAEAKKADAEKWAPYEYWGALQYLTKAREEAGYGDYQAAVELGRKAEELAVDAKELAIERSASEPEGADPVMWQNSPPAGGHPPGGGG